MNHIDLMSGVVSMVKTLLTPELYCSNIQLSIAFYTKILGFNIQYQREDEGFVMLERQGSRIMLEEIRNDSRRVWLNAPLEKPFGRGINFEIKTSHVDLLYDHVQKSAAVIFLPIEEKWYRANNVELGNRQFIVQDPDGYMLRFAENIGERKI
ncbi:MAG TPA: VOC family protein [Candidatus Saccharimonadales bacterium]|nr:VOC family protein [Candidatus Saccharimonadales bacterium]